MRPQRLAQRIDVLGACDDRDGLARFEPAADEGNRAVDKISQPSIEEGFVPELVVYGVRFRVHAGPAPQWQMWSPASSAQPTRVITFRSSGAIPASTIRRCELALSATATR